MTEANIADRLAALPGLSEIPRQELEWLAAHGKLEVREAGAVIAPKGKRVENLWIILSGHVVVQVDRGAGPKRVTEWRAGDVSGMLPYSRMTGPPGDNYLDERSELLGIPVTHFPGMIHECPVFTAHTVHKMIDRARSFNASDLQDEKMVSLGKLAAGLAHELNNPASAAARSAKLLLSDLDEADSASRVLGEARLPNNVLDVIEHVRSACLAKPTGAVLSAIEQADREDEIADWLIAHNVDQNHAQTLAATPITIEELNTLVSAASGDTLAAALQWIASRCATHSLAVDIEQATTRISDLVAAIKRFTYMDNLAGSELVNVELGLRDTIRIVASKAKSKGAAITLDVEPNLPRVQATGGELNQVWLNLIDNALDAIPENGRIEVTARLELDRLVVRVVDNGNGIPPDSESRIFDPFFTTKPPGQGTGLGLDLSRRILRRYHGDITFQSRPGLTEFRVILMTDKSANHATDGPS